MLMGLMPIFQVLLSPDFGASYGSTEYERELVGKKMTSVFVKKKKIETSLTINKLIEKERIHLEILEDTLLKT